MLPCLLPILSPQSLFFTASVQCLSALPPSESSRSVWQHCLETPSHGIPKLLMGFPTIMGICEYFLGMIWYIIHKKKNIIPNIIPMIFTMIFTYIIPY